MCLLNCACSFPILCLGQFEGIGFRSFTFHLPYSSLDHLEIGHWNWKLDFLLVTCIPQFSQQDLLKSSRVYGYGWNSNIQYFMPVLVTCKFDDDPIKNTGAIVSTAFLPALKGR